MSRRPLQDETSTRSRDDGLFMIPISSIRIAYRHSRPHDHFLLAFDGQIGPAPEAGGYHFTIDRSAGSVGTRPTFKTYRQTKGLTSIPSQQLYDMYHQYALHYPSITIVVTTTKQPNGGTAATLLISCQVVKPCVASMHSLRVTLVILSNGVNRARSRVSFLFLEVVLLGQCLPR
jgi:hypothetical protein